MKKSEKFYSIKDLAKLLGNSERQWWRWIQWGELDVLRLGRRTFVAESSLNKFLQNYSRQRRRPKKTP